MCVSLSLESAHNLWISGWLYYFPFSYSLDKKRDRSFRYRSRKSSTQQDRSIYLVFSSRRSGFDLSNFWDQRQSFTSFFFSLFCSISVDRRKTSFVCCLLHRSKRDLAAINRLGFGLRQGIRGLKLQKWAFLHVEIIARRCTMFSRLFGKPNEKANDLSTMDKLYEVRLVLFDWKL